MRTFFLWFLSFQLAIMPTLTYAKTSESSGVSQKFATLMQQMSRPSWFSKGGSLHQQLGIDVRSFEGSPSQLRAVELEASQNPPRPFDPTFKGYTEGQLKDDLIRSRALREYRAVLENIAKVLETSFHPKQIQSSITEEYSRRIADPELRQRLLNDPKKVELRRLVESIEVEKYQDVVKNLKNADSMNHGNSKTSVLELAKQNWQNAANAIKNPIFSRLYRMMARYNTGPQTTVSEAIQNHRVEGAATLTDIGSLQFSNQNARDFIQEIKQGKVQMTRMTALIMGFLFISSVMKMTWAYENNPNIGEDTIKMFLNPAIYLSGITYFMGANATHYASLESLRLAAMGLDKTLKMKDSFFKGRYDAFRSQFKVQMGALSYIGLAGGFIILPTMFQLMEQATSCLSLIDRRPIQERRILKS
ncbi:MAG: hypothetical protein KDD34_09510 [Bdellovibrionales bacterium]|nr:hypothetical protein [Bdellovibrionales bacterium]